jgi:hypothetical protein
MDRIDQAPHQHSPGAHTAPIPPVMSPADRAAHEAASYIRPAAWTDDDNEPVIPRIPGPRKPGVTAALDLIGAGA